MKTIWRISNHLTLDGNGGKRTGARWHSVGRRIVYLADHPMSAIVETLVHLNVDGEDIPDAYTLLKVSAPDSVSIEDLQLPDGESWRHETGITQKIGDVWLASAKTALARVPSVIAPHRWNYLLNPLHPDAAQMQIAEVIREQFDKRLVRFGAR